MLTFSEDIISRSLWHEGKEYLFFSGTSYLGLSSNEEFHKILKDGIDKFGSNHPMSRISNVRFEIYHQFEKQFATDFLAEDCTSLKYNIFISPEAHPALWSGLSLSTNNISHNTWIEQIITKLNLNEGRNNVIFCNSLNSLSGEVYDFDWIDKIKHKINITLVIDDSHGIGVIGTNGKGVIENVEKYVSMKY